MTEKEFIILDEIYFLTPWQEIENAVDLSQEELIKVLISLWGKGWLRCYYGVNNELDSDTEDIENQFDKYHYLASKEGLMAHNTR